MLKEGDSFIILDINISVSSDKKKGICVLVKKLINADPEVGESRYKLSIFAMSREVDADMDGSLVVGKRKNDWSES